MTQALTPVSYYDVIEACAKPGCPFCQLAEKSVNRYLDGLMHEQVNDPGTRAVLRKARGFCNEHAWRLPATGGGAPLGIAIIYDNVLSDVLKALDQAAYSRPRSLSLRPLREALDRDLPAAATAEAAQRLVARAECPACVQRDTMETLAVTAMVNALADDERMRAALKVSSGLCLVHLRRAFELTRNKEAFLVLLAITREKIADLHSELAEFIRKNDYRFNQEGFGPEGNSWRCAIAWMVGAAGVR